MAETAFTPQQLCTPVHYSQFLEGKEEAHAIRQGRYTAPFYSRSSVQKIYSFFSFVALTLSSYLLAAICLEGLSKRAWVFSRHAYADLSVLKTQEIFQRHFLARSINTHKVGTEDFYLSKPFPAPPLPYFAPGYAMPPHIHPFHEKGICRGMSFWFIYLYLKTKSQGSNCLEHMRSVGMQFEKGASRQMALLQSMTWPPIYGLLGLKVQQNAFLIPTAAKTPAEIAGSLHALPCGTYSILTSEHQMTYIKESPSLQFLFEPRLGTIHVETPALLEKALEGSLSEHQYPHPLLIDGYTLC